MKRDLLRPSALALSVALACGSLAYVPVAKANEPTGPTGGQVTGGQATISRPNDARTLIEQQSQNAVLDWQTFNVANGHTVEFQQPGANATALNRIHDQNPSQIFGAIIANGNVFLLNPNGIVFGETASVNVNSFMATTLDVSPEDFMAGNWSFEQVQGGSGMIINRGLIAAATSGSVTLVAGAVVNEGVILANYGQVTLASGTRTYVDFDGDGLLRFEVSGTVGNNPGAEDAVANHGTITANGGQILLTANTVDAIFRNAVNNTGIVEASRIENVGGVVRLGGGDGNVSNTGTIAARGEDGDGGSVNITGANIEHFGTIDVSSSSGDGGAVVVHADDTVRVGGNAVIDASSSVAVGGNISLLGDRVGLFETATIDASGALGGGTVLVGGDFQGANPEITNASITYVAPDVLISADATDLGDGGTVIVWADDTTRFFGKISAVGGESGGDGGFAEVSGARYLDYRGLTDLSSAHGTVGTLLLDPTDIEICSSAGSCAADVDVVGNGSGGDPFRPEDPFVPVGPNTVAILTWESIETALGTANVVVTTVGSPVTGLQNGDITVVDGFEYDEANTLTLETAATGTVIVNSVANIQNNGVGNIEINSLNVELNATISTGGSLSGLATAVTVNAGGSIQNGIDVVDTTSGGTVTVGAGTFTEDLSITTDNLVLDGNGAGSSIIVGVATQGATFPDVTNSTNVSIVANGVTIQDFTIRSPEADASTNAYSSGVVLNGTGITIQNNAFEIRQTGDGTFNGTTSVALQTVSGADISNLQILNNTFGFSGTAGIGNGYHGIWIQPGIGAGAVTISGNQMTGRIWRGIALERGNATISGNTITTNTLDAAVGNIGIRIGDTGGASIDGVSLSNNTVGGAVGGQSFDVDFGFGYAAADPLTNINVTGTNTGDIQLVGDVTNAGGLTWTTTGAIELLGSVYTTDGSNISLTANNGEISLAGGEVISTTAAADSAIDSGDVFLTATGTGTINLTGTIDTRGASHSTLTGSAGGAVVIEADNGVITVGQILASGGDANAGIGGAAGAISLTSAANLGITLNGALTAVGGTGPTPGAGNTVDILTSGNIALGGGISTGGGALTLGVIAGPAYATIELQTAITLSTGAGSISAGNITAAGAGQDLDLVGSGTSVFASINLGDDGAGDGDFNTALVTGGTVTVTGSFAAGSITTGAAAYELVFQGGGSVTGGTATTFSNTGGLTIGASFAFDSGLITAGGPPMTIGGASPGTVEITATSGVITLGSVTINDGFTLSLGDGVSAVPITLAAVSGVAAGAQSNLIIDTGAATVSLAGTIGTDIGSVAVTSDRNIVVTGDITTVGSGITMTAHAAANIAQNFFGLEINGATLSAGTGVITLTGTGGNDGADNYGVHVHASSVLQTTSGNITITGTGGAATAERNYGVRIDGGSVQVTGSGAVSITGTGGSGTFNNYGVLLTGSVALQVGAGGISVDGQGGSGTGDSQVGVLIRGGAVVSSTGTGASAAGIAVNGSGGSGANNNYGIYVSDAGTSITSVDGAVSLIGLGAGIGDLNRGVMIISGAAVSSTGTGTDAATVTINGTGGAGAASNIGVHLESPITSVNGDIAITGQGGAGTGHFNHGIYLDSAISSTGTGADAATITLDGTGGAGASNNFGIFMNGPAAQITSDDGAISVTGIGGSDTTGGSNYGVRIQGGAGVSSTGTGVGAATIDIHGTGADGTDLNIGVAIFGLTTFVTSVDGDITITGFGGDGSADRNFGVTLENPTVSSTGTDITNAATITINGTGGNGTSTNFGVRVAFVGLVTSVAGAIDITGVGGDGSSTNNSGVVVDQNGDITSTGTGANAATITISGTGGAGTSLNRGVVVDIAGSLIASVEGAIDITGTSGANSAEGIVINGGTAIGDGTTAGSINIESLAGALQVNGTIRTTGNVTLVSGLGNLSLGEDAVDTGASTTSIVTLTATAGSILDSAGVTGAGGGNPGYNITTQGEVVFNASGDVGAVTDPADVGRIQISGTGVFTFDVGGTAYFQSNVALESLELDDNTSIVYDDGNGTVLTITGDGAGNVTVSDGGQVAFDGFTLTIVNGANLVLDGSAITVGGTGDLILTVDGNIVGTGAGPHLIGGGLLSLTSNNGNVAVIIQLTGTGSIQVDAANGTVTLFSSGGVGLVIGGLGINANGIVGLLGNSPVDVNAPISSTGDIVIVAEGNAATDIVTINDSVTATDGDVYVYAGGNIDFTATGTVGTVNGGGGGGSVALYAGVSATADPDNTDPTAVTGVDIVGAGDANADIVMDAASTINAATGDVTLVARRNIVLAAVTATNQIAVIADTPNFGAAANGTGAITTVGDDLASTTILLSAASGIGTVGTPIETNTVNLAATSATGGIYINEANALTIDQQTGGALVAYGTGTLGGGSSGATTTINGVTTTTSGDIVVDASALTVSQAISAAGGSNILLVAAGAGAASDITVNAGITATGGTGSITLYAADRVTQANATTISVESTGSISISAGVEFDVGTMTASAGTSSGHILHSGSTSAIASDDGNITLTATGQIDIAHVDANDDGDATRGDVSISAGDNTHGVGAANSNLNNVGGSGNVPHIIANDIQVRATGTAGWPGNGPTYIAIDATSIDLEIGGAYAAFFEVVGAITDGLLVDRFVVNGDTGSSNVNSQGFYLSSQGDLVINGTVSTAGRISMLSSGSITMSAGSITISDATALTAGAYLRSTVLGDIGATGTPVTITAPDGIVLAAVTVDGDVFVNIDGDVTIGLIGFPGQGNQSDIIANGNIEFESTGSITVSDGRRIDAGSGTISITAEDDVTLGRVVTTNTTSGAISITSNSGGVVDGGDTGGTDISTGAGGRATISVATVIGYAGAIETSVTELDLSATTGAIRIVDTDAVTVIGADAGGLINISNSAGTLAVTGAVIAGSAVDLTAAGLLSLSAAGDIDAGNVVTLTGTSGISTAGDVTTTADNVDFVSATTLTGDVVIISAGGNITFQSTLDGAFDLTLTAGGGDIAFQGNVGVGGDDLVDVTINSADAVTIGNMNLTGTLLQVAGSSVTSLTGAVNAASVDITTTAISSNAAGDITILASGTGVTMSVTRDITLAGDIDATASEGDISLTADATSGNDAVGITLNGNTVATAGAGTITMVGEGSGTDSDIGVSILSATVTVVDGALTITGTGADGGNNSIGVYIEFGSVIESTGTGTPGAITITGFGGPDLFNWDDGVYIESGSSVESVDADIIITGTGYGPNSWGVQIGSGGASVTSTGTGSITITGTVEDSDGSTSVGVRIIGGAAITTNSGDIVMDGEIISGTDGGFGIVLTGDFDITSTSGNITLSGTGLNGELGIDASSATPGSTISIASATATLTIEATNDGTGDTIHLGSNIAISGAGHLLLQPILAGDDIGLGDALVYVTDGYILDSTELQNLVDGFADITVGRADGAHFIEAGELATFYDPLTVRTPVATPGTIGIIVTGTLFGSDSVGADPTIDLTVNAADVVELEGGTVLTTGAAVTITSNLVIDGASFILTNLILPAGGDVDVLGTTVGTGAADDTLQMNAGTGGVITFNLAVGDAANTLNGLTVTNAGTSNLPNVRIDGGNLDVTSTTINLVGTSFSTVGFGDIYFDGAVVLATGNTSVTTADGLFEVTGTLISAGGNLYGLDIDTGLGDILFTGPGDIGFATTVSAFTLGYLNIVDAADATFDGFITTTGAVTQVTGTGATTFNGAVLADNIDVETNNIIVNGTLDSAAGDIVLTGTAVSAGQFVGVLINNDVTATANIVIDGTGGDTLNNNRGVRITNSAVVSTTTGDITITGQGGTGAGNGHGGVTLSAGFITTTSGTITIAGAGGLNGDDLSSGHFGVSLTNGSAITTTGTGAIDITGTGGDAGVGNLLASHGILVNGSNITAVGGPVTLTGTALTTSIAPDFSYGISAFDSDVYTQNGDLTFIAVGTNGAGLITNSTGVGTTNFGFATNAGNTSITVTNDTSVDSITFLGTTRIRGAGDLLLQPGDSTHSIGIGTGATGNFNLDEGEIAAIQDGFNFITIGQVAGTHAFQVGTATFLDDTTFRTTGAGTMTVATNRILTGGGAGDVGGSDGNLTLLSDTPILLGGNIVTYSNIILLDGQVLVSGNRTVRSQEAGTGGNIFFTGDIDGANVGGDTLTINAGTTGILDLQGDVVGQAGTQTVAAGEDLNGLTITAAQADLPNIQLTGGNLLVTATSIFLDGSTYQTHTSGNISFIGALVMNTGTTGVTADAGTVLFDGTVDGASDLTISGTGVTFEDAVGGITPLVSLVVTGATNMNAGSVDTTGLQTFNDPMTLGADVVLTSTAAAVITLDTVDGAFRFEADTDGTVFLTGTIGGTIDLTEVFIGADLLVMANGVSVITAANDGDITFFIDGLTLGGANTIDAGAGTFQIYPRTSTFTVEFSPVDSTERNVWYDSDFTLVTAGQFIVGDLGQLGNIYLGNAANTVTAPYSLTVLNVGGASIVVQNDYNAPGETLTLTPGTGGIDIGYAGSGAAVIEIEADTVYFNAIVDATDAGDHGLLVTGNAEFDGDVGTAANLASLEVTGTTLTSTNTAAVTTTGFQQFTGAVTVGAAIDFQSTTADITFGDTLDGAFDVTVDGFTGVTFDGMVGGTTPLASLDVTGSTTINGGYVETSGDQTYNSDVTVGALTDFLSTAGSIQFVDILDGAFDVTVDGFTTVTFDGMVGDTTPLASLDVTGSTAVNGGYVETSGDQTFNDDVTVGAATDFLSTAGAIGFGDTLDGAFDVTVDGFTTVTFDGMVGDTTPLASLDVTGATAVNGGYVETSGNQTYNDNVTVGADTDFLSTAGNIWFVQLLDGAFNVDVDAANNVFFDNAVGFFDPLASLTVTGSTDVNGGYVETTGDQTYNDDVTVGSDTDFLSTAGAIGFGDTLDGANNVTVDGFNGVTFTGAVGFNAPLASLDVTGSTDVNGGLVDTTGDQAYNSDVTVGAATDFLSTAGAIGFGDTLDGAFDVDVNGTTGVTFDGEVGGIDPLASLAVTGATTINGGLVDTTGDQTYNSATVIGAATDLVTAGGTIWFVDTVNSDTGNNWSLVITTGAGFVIVDGVVGGVDELLEFIVESATDVDINAAITTDGGIIRIGDTGTRVDVITIDGVLTTLPAGTAGSLIIDGGGIFINASPSVGDHNIELYGNGLDIIITADIVVNNSLIATAPRDIIVEALVRTLDPAADLSLIADNDDSGVGGTLIAAIGAVDAGRDLLLQGGAFTNLGGLGAYPAYVGMAVIIENDGANNQAEAGGAISIQSNGSAAVGNVVVAGLVEGRGTGTVLFDAAGVTVISADVTTANGNVVFADPTTLAGAVTVDTGIGAGDVWFQDTVDGAFDLVVAADAGTVTFDGMVGDAIALASLDVTGPTVVNGGYVETTGNQTYNSDVTLGALTNFLSTAGQIQFVDTLDGAFNVTVNGNTGVIFDDEVGGIDPLTGLTVTGSTAVNGGYVETTGGQRFNSDVTVGVMDADFLSTMGSIHFVDTLDGAFNITVDGFAGVAFDGMVGGATPLASLVVTGSTDVNGGYVETTGNQTFNSDVTVGVMNADFLSTGGAISFADTLDGPFAVDVDAATVATFDAEIGLNAALGQFTVTASAIALNAATVDTDATGSGDGSQSYTGAVVLGTDTALTTAGTAGEDITVTGTVDSAATMAYSLTLDTGAGGNILFTGSGDVGAAVDGELTDLTILAAQDATFDGVIDLLGNLTQVLGTGYTEFYGAVTALSVDLTTLSIFSDTGGDITVLVGGSGVTMYAMQNIDLRGDVDATATGGDIMLTATGIGPDNEYGIHLDANTLQTDGAGTIVLEGTASGTGKNGVRIVVGAVLSVENGALTITGTGGAGGNTVGVLIDASSLVSTGVGTPGDVTITGFGGPDIVSYNDGVYIQNGTFVTTADANIVVSGTTSQDYGPVSWGVYIDSTVQSTGLGAVTITGTSELATGFSYGVYLWTGATILTNSGDVAITGTVLSGAGGGNGIYIQGMSQYVYSATGNITLTGTGLAGQLGIDASGAVGAVIEIGDSAATLTVEATNNGTNDTIDLSGGITLTGPGNLLLQPIQVGDAIGIGDGTSVVNGYVLENAELANIDTTFATVTIGRADGQHAIEINTASFPATGTLTIQSPVAPGAVALTGTFTLTGVTDLIFISAAPLYLGGDIITDGTNVLVIGPMLVDGDRTIDNTDGGAVPTGGTLTVTGAIDGANVGGDSLTIDVGSSIVDLQGPVEGQPGTQSVIGGEDLAGLDITAGTANLFDVTTTAGDITVLADFIVLNGSTYSTVTSGLIFFDGTTQLQTDATLMTAGGAGDDITLLTVEGNGFNLDLDSGAGGNIAVTDTVTGVAILEVVNTNDALFSGIVTVDEILLTAATGTVTFDDVITATDMNALAGVNNVVLSVSGTVTNLATFANTGTFSIVDGFVFTGGVTAVDPLVELGGALVTVGGDVNFGDTTLTNNATIDTADGNVNIASIDGATLDLALTLGAGALDVAGTALDFGTLDLVSAASATFNDQLTATTLLVQAGVVDVSLLGGGTVTNAVTFENTGTLLISMGFNFTNGVTATAPTLVQLAGLIATVDSDALFGVVELVGDTDIETGAGGGDITVTGTTDGAFALTLSAGTGNTDLQDVVGGATPLASLTVTDATSARFGADVTTTGDQLFTATTVLTNGVHTTTDSAITVTGELVLESDTSLVNGNGVTTLQLVNGAGLVLTIENAGGLDLSDNITVGTLEVSAVTGPVDLTGDVAIVVEDTDVDFGNAAGIDGNQTLDIDAGTGTVTLPVVGAGTALSTLTITGAGIVLTGDLTTQGAAGDITLTGAVELVADVVITATDAGSDLVVDGTTDGAFVLTVDVGVDLAQFTGTLGGITPLASAEFNGGQLRFEDGAHTTGTQEFTGSLFTNGEFSASELIINNTLTIENGSYSVFITDVLTFNGGASSVTGTGSGTLSLIPATADGAIDIGGVSGVLNIDPVPFQGFQGFLSIGGEGTLTREPDYNSLAVYGGPITVNAAITLDVAGQLALFSEGDLTLQTGDVTAGRVWLAAIGTGSRILNNDQNSAVISDDFTLIAADRVGEGYGQEVNLQSLTLLFANAQLAQGGPVAFINNINNSVTINSGATAPFANTMATYFGITPFGTVFISSFSQSTAVRETAEEKDEETSVDRSLFEEINLWAVEEPGQKLPADQDESGGDCDPDDLDCELLGMDFGFQIENPVTAGAPPL